MDKVAIFYILNAEDDINHAICKIIKKYFEQEKRVIVSSKDQNVINNINNLLWTFEQLSFIPHCIEKDYDSLTPVLLMDANFKNDSISKKDYNIFINLDDEEKTDYHDHDVIVEVVSDNERIKKLAREKYLYYKKNKLNVKHENL